MKKLLFPVLLLAFVLALGCASAQQTTTVLVYLCGSDMQDAACVDVAEMAEVEAGDAINLVVLAGGSPSWDMEEFRGNSRTLAVIRNGYFEQVQDWGWASMGSPECLEEFLRFGLTRFPADRTIVILWDHGAGSGGGVCVDETTDSGDSLTVAEINLALGRVKQSVPGFHINIFGCDACMMATYEMAVTLSQFDIDYYVASEELEIGEGWNYTPWLKALKDDPALSDEELCRLIAGSYMEYGLSVDPYDYLTISAVSLAEIPALQRSMEKFAAVMTGEIRGGNLSAVRRGRSRMYTFGSYDDGSWDMVDLGAVLDTYAQFDPQNAAEARRSLSAAVVVNRQTENLDACCGLSILIPQDTASTFDEYRDGFDISAVIPNWVEFVNGYADMLRGGHYQFSSASPSHFTEDPGFTDTFIPSSCSPSGYCSWDDDAGTYSEGAWEEEEIQISDGEQGFTAVLSQEDLAHLDYVEGMLMMNVSGDDGEFYVEFGLVRNNLVDWKTGTVVSLFDGTWPVFGGQLVPLYDQSSNEHSRRSLIPVKLNGEYTYLVVVFPAGSTEGQVIGANAGYDESGLPIRNTTKLKDGDVIIPVYTTYASVEGSDDMEEGEFDGDPVAWQEGMTVRYEDIADDEEPTEMVFSFVFNDIFGEYTLSELVSFEL